MANRDDIYHGVKLTTGGVALEFGVTPELRYMFKISETSDRWPRLVRSHRQFPNGRPDGK
ncbi:hypothetical protein K7H13_03390 [Qipengyuania citrea]|uniref:hypothetical protein n=1 Tax=Qipengyuania citrea TaxID=225971 RepID=UPI001E51BE29|nr:hypothetical protein [Qipengyuania citrea]MCD1589806.1 hypothetical protein [Qipengyuania citrea]